MVFLIFLIGIVKLTKPIKSYDSPKKSKHIIYLDTNNLHVHAMSKFFATSGLKWIYPNEFDLNKYTKNSSKGCVFEVGFNTQKSYENYTVVIP